ncbi:class II aldolase/adducin family protein [Acuticoccus sediminis]|uniref:class II aldolase/adducin family protein n=1 Tax=Acuticoccus sediminis TaxID=2184697 RepID=UPI001CFC5D80|nr:class II aldolase/adducin family protein [Acuticoccus sediminis]
MLDTAAVFDLEGDAGALDALRIDLAAAFRLTARFGWHESVGNHFTASISRDGRRFLMNPRWRHFGEIRASDLQVLDADDPDVMLRSDAPDLSGWTIHGAVHRTHPHIRVLLHCHPPHATALACLKDPSLPPVDQNTARFYGCLGVDLGFGGIANDTEEGERLAVAFGDHRVLIMGNHGVSVAAPTVAEAFEDLYFLERSAQIYLLALSSGRPLSVMSDALAQKTADGWLYYRAQAFEHFEHLKRQLDQLDPSYRD